MSVDEQFMRLWTKAEPMVAAYVHSVIRDFHVCQDVIQEIAVVLLRKFPEYDATRPFGAWAMGVARVEILTARRDQARDFLTFRPDLMDALAAAHEELSGELELRRAAMTRCVEGVKKERSRQVLRLRYVEALPPGRIAQRLGVQAGAVRTLLSRVRADLRDCVKRQLARQESGR
ncbi:MAG: sigma-70 family RNA polymerase sigma factor [Planctomycetota bacterium]